MKAVHEKIKVENEILSNSAGLQDKIRGWIQEYSDADRISKEQNEKRQAIREKAAEAGLDTLAFQARYAHYKLDRHKRDGYDDTVKIMDEALHNAENRDFWEWRKKPEPKAKAPNKNAAKPPKAATGKPSPDTGKQQAEAYNAAHGENITQAG